MIKIKRIYDPPMKEDGFRILVDRLWPRGISKVEAKVNLWLKEIVASDGLRKWFLITPKNGKDLAIDTKWNRKTSKNCFTKCARAGN